LTCLNSQAQENIIPYGNEFEVAKQSILNGHVKDGLGQMALLLERIDATKEPNFWSLSISFADYLDEEESYAEETNVLNQLLVKTPPNANPFIAQQTLFRVGRNLAFTGHASEGEKVLKNVTAEDVRAVYTPPQRAAARILSQIELDRGNIGQAAIWIRRAVVGTQVDKSASSEEIVDTLTDYAKYLRRTKRLFQSYDLLTKLIPTYDQSFSHRSSKYLHFTSELLESARSVGNHIAADNIYKILKENTDSVDTVAPSVRNELLYHDLFSAASHSSADGNPAVVEQLKEIAASNPDWIKQPDIRITFSYFFLLARDLDLAEQYGASPSGETLTPQLSAYELAIRSYIAAWRSDFDSSNQLLDAALTRMNNYLHEFAKESSSRLPAISFDERLVLSSILGLLSQHVSAPDQANIVFRLEQFLNRDKAKLGLATRVARQSIASDLVKEDLRTRDRLKDLRERLLTEATKQLLGRTLPVKAYTPGSSNDYAPLTQLEGIEDRIVAVETTTTKSSNPDFENKEDEGLLPLSTTQKLLRPDEALVTHVVILGQGLVVSCITSKSYQFEFSRLSHSDVQQLTVDTKLLVAALQGQHDPSPELDSSFPAASSFRLYLATFGKVQSCLDRKHYVFLATDADMLSLPWNALITEFDSGKEFRNKEAAWIIRAHALSLLPSVGSLHQLRINLPRSATTANFLGIGDPDFEGHPNPASQIALAPLIGTRGVGIKEAIRHLPRLPEASKELLIEAKALGATASDLLLGAKATERALRSKALETYKIISFATHALVAGEIDDSTEPGLVLSPGDEDDNPKNDGLVTATEVADLSLDANLVILSACNTAGPDGRINSRGLSGLADAFFFAGARSIAVTQWAVLSDAAERIGSGIVSVSVRQRDLGVAEALRQTTLDFISSATKDYTAHPRFWAAFIVAGDGKVAALGSARQESAGNKIRVQHEALLQENEQAELSYITATNKQTNHSIGMAMPPTGEKRAGSYIAKIDPTGDVSVLTQDREMGASRIFEFESGIGVTGYYPSTCTSCPQGSGKSAAVFKLLSRNGKERWKIFQESANLRVGMDIVKTTHGYILVSLELDQLSNRNQSIWLTAVSASGNILQEKQIAMPLILATLSRGTTIDKSGNLILAVGGQRPTSQNQFPSMQSNPLTGSKRFGCFLGKSSLIFSIDPETLAVRQQLESNSGEITRLRTVDGEIFATVNFSKDCRFEKNIKLLALDLSKRSERTIFETAITNSAEARDFEISERGFVIVGKISTYLPFTLLTKSPTPEQLKNYVPPDLLNESIWDKWDYVGNAVILVVSKDGRLLADRVLHDARNKSLFGIAARGGNRYVASGGAQGDRGWVIEFSELTN
jgi:CHAT domain-containing protein